MTIEIAGYQRNLEIENLVYQQQLEVLLEERKRENDEITALFKTIAENSLVGMTIIQEDKIVFANMHIAELLGIEMPELLSMNPLKLLDLIHPDDKETMVNRMEMRMKEADAPNASTYRIVRRDGSVVHLESYSRLIKYKGKSALHYLYFDITSYWEALKGKEN
jgi:PAS domain S-box-containing protein